MASAYESDRSDRELSEDELLARARAVHAELARRGTTSAFSGLIALSAELGEAMGEAARNLAAHNSWSQVAEISGTSKQAAWSRWR